MGLHAYVGAAMAALIAATSCGDDDAPGTGTGERPLYMVHVETETTDGTRFVYLATATSLSAEIDVGRALELGGRSQLRTAFGKVYAFSSEDVIVTRYAISDDGIPIQELRFGLTGLGLTNLNGAIAFVSEELALIVSAGTSQFVWWNPATLEIIEATPFPSSLDDLPPETAPLATLPIVPSTPTVTPDGRYIIVPYYTLDQSTLQAESAARAFILDSSTRQVVAAPFDPRCPGSSRGGVLDPATGDYIYVGDAVSGFLSYFADPPVSPGCLLRIPAGTTGFDPEWKLDVSAMNPNGFTDLADLLVSDDRFLAVFRDEDQGPVADLMNPLNYFGGDGIFYRPYVGSTSDWVGSAVSGFDDRSMFGFPQVVDGQFLISPANITDRGPDVVSEIYRVNGTTLERVNSTLGFIRRFERIR